jgi:hypothetical protein
MPVVSPPSVTALPTPPSTASPSNFDTRADAYLAALPVNQTEINALAANVFANATDAATSATTATTQAGLATSNGAAQVALAAAQVTLATTQAGNAATSATNASNSALAAAAAAGAALWVSGATYSLGDVAYSAVTARVYRRIVAGAGATDPSADGANWKAYDTSPFVVNVTGTSQLAVAFTHYVLKNAGLTTVTLPASPSAGDVVRVTWKNARANNVVARNGQLIGDEAIDTPLDTNIRGTAEFRFVDNSWEVM